MNALWMLVASVLFSAMGACVKLAGRHYGVTEILFYRSLIGALCLWGFVQFRGMSLATPLAGMHLRRGVVGTAAVFLWFFATTLLPLGTALTLNYTSPLFLVVLVASLARERPSRALVGTVLLGFAGVLLLLRPAFSAEQAWPGIVGLASGALASVAYWNVRELVRAREPEARVVFWFSAFAVAGSLVWMAPQRWHALALDNAGDVAGAALLGAAGQLMMTRAYGKGSTLVVGALSYSGIVFSSVLGVAMLGDRLPLASWLGMLVIVAAGIMAIQLQAPRKRAVPASSSD
jgi:drug/metabolite transporter (DMT)-like permease